MAQGNVFSDDVVREFGDLMTWWRRESRGGGNLENDPTSRFGPRTVRIGRTTTSVDYPSYPPRPANTFVVEFGRTEFEAIPGLRTIDFEPYDPAFKRVCRDMNCAYHEEGTLVICFLVHDQWHIVGGIPELLAIAELAVDVCDQTTGISVREVQTLPRCAAGDFTTVTNPRRHRGPEGSQVLLVKKTCDEAGLCDATEEWQIADVELRPYCPTVGIEHRPSCLVAAGLQVAGEWCPDDEPVTACLIVDYTKCSGTLPPCDLDWTFTPLFACCGQGSGGESQEGGGGDAQATAGGSTNMHPGNSPGNFSGRFLKSLGG